MKIQGLFKTRTIYISLMTFKLTYFNDVKNDEKLVLNVSWS